MIIEKGIKINKIGISVSSDRPYFEIQFIFIGGRRWNRKNFMK